MTNTPNTADHKTPTTTLPAINGLDAKTIAGVIVTILIQANSALAAFGLTPVPVPEQGVYTGVSVIVALLNVAYAVWTNFNFTKAARQGQQVTDAIKLAQKNGGTEDSPIEPMGDMSDLKDTDPNVNAATGETIGETA